MTKRLLLASVIGFVAVSGLIAATRVASRPGIAVTPRAANVDVQLTTASLRDIGEPFEIGGDVRASETATMASRIVAEVNAIRVQPGDRVRAGQTLIVLDARDLSAGRARAQASVGAAEQAAQLAAAERQAADAALALASTTYRRVADLRQKNSATASEFDDAQAALRAAEARRKSADAQIAQAAAGIDVARAAARAAAVNESFATISAPFDGVVTQKLIDPGNLASPGVPLMTIENDRSFRLEVRIDESRAGVVALGQPVDVVIDNLDSPVAGRVVEMSRLLDPVAHAFLAKIALPAVAGLRSGMFARARFTGPPRRVLAVPETSVVRRGQITSVFVVDPSGHARLRLVALGEPMMGQVEVRSGLEAGEHVVVSPPVTLVDGAPVRAYTVAPAASRLSSPGARVPAEGLA